MNRIAIAALGALAFATFGLETAPASAASAFGTWNRPDGSKAKVWKCGGKMCGKVISGPKAGFVMFNGIKKAGGNTWKGNMKHPKMGSWLNFNGTVNFKGGKLHVRGCMIGGSMCDAEVWKR